MLVTMTTAHEREILKEFIEVYRDNPCLWDMTSELYRNKEMKHEALGLMTRTLRKLDPDANVSTTKKKVENMRAVYFRELKKVRASELTATDEGDIFEPNLWYFKLISFLDIKEFASRADPLRVIKQAPTSDEESMESAELLELEIEQEIPIKRKSLSSSSSARKLKRIDTSIHTFVEPLKELRQPHEQKKNSFGIYVGEQLEQVSTFQRNLAERLISEVLFLAKTGNLNYESKIDSKIDSQTKASEYGILSTRKVEMGDEPKALLKELLSDGSQK